MENIIRGEASDRSVFIDGRVLLPYRSQNVYSYSPDGFNWGYGGSGPAQLALAILLEFTSKDTALRLHQGFKWEVIAPLPRGDFELKIDVQRWIEEAMGEGVEELLVIEPVVGCRIWMIRTGIPGLCSVSARYVWAPGVNVARCESDIARGRATWTLEPPRGLHPAPEFSCGCGLYSCKDIVAMEGTMSCGVWNIDFRYVFGEVELTGKVIEHEFGYRAERAQIKTLVYSPPHDLYAIREIASYYKVPLVSYDEYIVKEVSNDKYRRAEKDFKGGTC